MAVQSGTDYGFSYHIRTVLKGAGSARATALITRRYMFVIPYVSISGGGMTIVRTTVTIGGTPPGDAVRRLLDDPATTVDSLEEQMTNWCRDIEGGMIRSIDKFKRIKLRNGFFTRMVMFSEKEKGFDSGFGTAVGYRPAKEEMPAYMQLFSGDPRLV